MKKKTHKNSVLELTYNGVCSIDEVNPDTGEILDSAEISGGTILKLLLRTLENEVFPELEKEMKKPAKKPRSKK